jgi:hypothetical protein
VAENLVLTSDHLTALAFTGRRSAQRRLALLAAAGLLERFRPPQPVGSAPAHYGLGPDGARLLAHPATGGGGDPVGTSSGGSRARRGIVLPAVSALRLRHTLGVADIYVALATAPRGDPAVRLQRWWGERTCTTWWGRHARPDAYGRWQAPDRAGHPRRVDFFLEYDTGSENLARLVAKLDGYQQLAEVTGITTPVLFHLPSPAREAGLHTRLAGRTPPDVPVATTTGMSGLTGPTWRPVKPTISGGVGGAGERLRLADLPPSGRPQEAVRPFTGNHGTGATGTHAVHQAATGTQARDVRVLPWPPPDPLPPPTTTPTDPSDRPDR